MSKLNPSEVMQLRVFARDIDDNPETGPEHERNFILERDGVLFRACLLSSIRQIAKNTGYDRETVTRMLHDAEPVEGPNGSKLYTYATFWNSKIRYMREKREREGR